MKELYLKKYDFNITVFINELNNLIKKDGGLLVNSWNGSNYPFKNDIEPQKIYNRYLLKTHMDFEKEIFEKMQDKNIPIEYITNSNLNYSGFIYNNHYYYIQISDNPFFDDYFQKIPVTQASNQNYIFYSDYSYYLDKVSTDLKNIYWKLYDFLTIRQIKNLAKKAFEILKNEKKSDIVHTKKRVSNYYNNNFHYENVAEKKRTNYFIIKKEG